MLAVFLFSSVGSMLVFNTCLLSILFNPLVFNIYLKIGPEFEKLMLLLFPNKFGLKFYLVPLKCTKKVLKSPKSIA